MTMTILLDNSNMIHIKGNDLLSSGHLLQWKQGTSQSLGMFLLGLLSELTGQPVLGVLRLVHLCVPVTSSISQAFAAWLGEQVKVYSCC